MAGNQLSIMINACAPGDWAQINSLLAASYLPSIQPMTENVKMLIARSQNEVVGCAGWEKYGNHALVRSVAIADTARGKFIGSRLVQTVLSYLGDQGVTDVYLLTENASEFFRKHNFKQIDRCGFPEVLKQSRQVSSVCCSSATAMHRKLTITP